MLVFFVRKTSRGCLMGLANLVPGVSGGTMVLVMGLYDEFIRSVADVTRLRLTRRNVLFLGVLVGTAAVAIVALSGTMGRLVSVQRSAMYALFIGMTLGGAPLLWKMLRPIRPAAVGGLVLGLAIMIAIAMTRQEKPDSEAVKAAAASGELTVVYDSSNYGADLAAGTLGMSSMVLPGISGAYMLLVLGRYEAILLAISNFKSYVLSGFTEGGASALHVLIPVAIGSILALVVLSNFLKWMLRHHEQLMLGTLLGILLGSVVGIWPFSVAVAEAMAKARAEAGIAAGTEAVVFTAADYGFGGVLAVAGYLATVMLSRMKK